MSEPDKSDSSKGFSLAAIIRRSLIQRQQIKLNRTYERLAVLKKEEDALVDKVDVALRAMQKKRKLEDSDARLTGQYSVDEMTLVKGGVAYDIDELTRALDLNRSLIAKEKQRLHRLTQALTPTAQ